jgi:hypothetical protein
MLHSKHSQLTTAGVVHVYHSDTRGANQPYFDGADAVGRQLDGPAEGTVFLRALDDGDVRAGGQGRALFTPSAGSQNTVSTDDTGWSTWPIE